MISLGSNHTNDEQKRLDSKTPFDTSNGRRPYQAGDGRAKNNGGRRSEPSTDRDSAERSAVLDTLFDVINSWLQSLGRAATGSGTS